MAFEKLALAHEVADGRTKFVCVRDTPVILANWQGRVYALYGICPHQNNPLEGATMWDNLIDCPFHHFQFNVETGENYFPKNVYPADYPRIQAHLNPLKTYPVEVRDDEVWVDLG